MSTEHWDGLHRGAVEPPYLEVLRTPQDMALSSPLWAGFGWVILQSAPSLSDSVMKATGWLRAWQDGGCTSITIFSSSWYKLFQGRKEPAASFSLSPPVLHPTSPTARPLLTRPLLKHKQSNQAAGTRLDEDNVSMGPAPPALRKQENEAHVTAPLSRHHPGAPRRL